MSILLGHSVFLWTFYELQKSDNFSFNTFKKVSAYVKLTLVYIDIRFTRKPNHYNEMTDKPPKQKNLTQNAFMTFLVYNRHYYSL